MIAIVIDNTQKVNVALFPKDAGGNPATLVGAPTWAVTSGDSTVVPAADGLSADLISGKTASDTLVTISAFAGPGSSDNPLSDTVALHVTAPPTLATSLNPVAGVPTAK